MIGSKALVGMSFCNQMKTSEYAIGKNCGAGLGTGGSLTFRARSNLGIRMFADYNLSFNRISPAKSTSHLIVIGGSVNVIFEHFGGSECSDCIILAHKYFDFIVKISRNYT